MPRVVESIEIKRPPQTVFAFLRDIEARIRLNPSCQVFGFEALTHQDMCAGARYRFFLMINGKRTKYECEVFEFVENKKIASRALDDRLQITLTLQKSPQGTLLTHDERFSLSDDVLYSRSGDGNAAQFFHDLWLKAHHLVQGLGIYDRDRERRIREIEEALRTSLRTWLGRIREKLESENS
jgi:hypothetical protein